MLRQRPDPRQGLSVSGRGLEGERRGAQHAGCLVSPAAGQAVTHLLYLHGFRSAPQSTKAQILAAWVREHRPELQWACPQLPPSPREAMALARRIMRDWPMASSAIIGSSLGGYYARRLAEDCGCRAVVLNPAVDPARDLVPFVGELPMYHAPAQTFDFRTEYLDELRDLHTPRLSHPERCCALIAKGDEVLDWREMSAAYAGATLHVLEGGDHGISDFEVHLPRILHFLNLNP